MMLQAMGILFCILLMLAAFCLIVWLIESSATVYKLEKRIINIEDEIWELKQSQPKRRAK